MKPSPLSKGRVSRFKDAAMYALFRYPVRGAEGVYVLRSILGMDRVYLPGEVRVFRVPAFNIG